MFSFLFPTLAFLIQYVCSQRTELQGVFSNEDGALRACYELAIAYPNQTVSTSDLEYSSYQCSYWSRQQSDLTPTCRFLPSNSQDVRAALEIIYAKNASFAISSGGHSSNPGFSNIDGGVTIDLSELNEIRVDGQRDEKSVWIGPGARWADVYRTLEPEKLTVAGGRVSHVGVGGLVLGGGISWFANQVGWSFDSILAFEVVTPDLQVRLVDQKEHPDLFWALKGSAGTLAVVTGIKMKAIEISPLAGICAGAIAFEEEQFPKALSVLAETSTNAEQDECTSSYISIGYLPAEKKVVYNAYIVNSKGIDDTVHLCKWKSVPNIFNGLRHTTIAESAHELSDSNPLGLRRSKFAITTLPGIEKLTPLHEVFRTFVQSLDLDPHGLVGMNFQPLTQPMLKSSAGNVFSGILLQDTAPIYIVAVELWWSDADRDTEYEGLMRELEAAMLGPQGVGWGRHVFAYPNYAAARQEPFSEWRLGEKTVEKLRHVKRLYDPEGIWERLRPNIWHM